MTSVQPERQIDYVGAGDEWRSVEYKSDHPSFVALGSELPIILIQRSMDGGWVDWLLAAESAVLRKVGAKKGYGLYALKPFRTGTFSQSESSSGRPLLQADEIGYYGGRVLYTAEKRERIHKWEREEGRPIIDGRRHLLPVKVKLRDGDSVWALVDGANRPALPFMHYANDNMNATRSPNCVVNQYGLFSAARNINPMDRTKPIEHNIQSELTWSYGEYYWNAFGETDQDDAAGPSEGHRDVIDVVSDDGEER